MNFVVSWILIEILIAEIMVGALVLPIFANELFIRYGEHTLHHESIVVDVVHHTGDVYSAEEFLDASEILFLFSTYTHICVGV